MRNSLLLLAASGALCLVIPACGGKLTDAESREFLSEGGIPTGTGGSDNAGGTGGSGGAGGDETGGAGGAGTTGTGGTGTTGTGGATGGSTGGTGGTGSGGAGGTGTGGGSVDAGAACPATQPSNGTNCGDATTTCAYGAMTCTCATSGGGGGNRRDAGMSWACGGADGGRGGRGG
jgi:hypothetical protein